MIVIRSATAADVPPIVEIWRASMALHGERDPTFRPRSDGHLVFARALADRIGSPDADVLIAEVDGAVAGYGITVLRERPALFAPGAHALVTDLDVAPCYRRNGLGERLLDVLIVRQRARGIDRIEAEVVLANEIAVGFWAKHGFVPYHQAMTRRI